MMEIARFEKTKSELNELGDRLYKEILFCNTFCNESNNQEIEKMWMSGVARAFNYSLTLIRCFLKSIDDYKALPSEQFNFYVGKIAIQHLLEVINKYEQIINSFIEENKKIDVILNRRLNEKLSIIEAGWSNEPNNGSKKLKKEVLKTYRNKKFEQAFIRDTLYDESVIDKTDLEILRFAWDIRNSMHKNFVAIKDISFSSADISTGSEYQYKYLKGEELYHPGNLVGFLSISVQLEFIMLKILHEMKE